MKKINQIIQLFGSLTAEERKAAVGMMRLADLLLDRLDQHGEIAVSSISRIDNKRNTVTVLEWMGFQLVTSCRAGKRPGKKPMAWRKNGHETV